MPDRLAELGAIQFAQNNPDSRVSRLGAAGGLQAAIADAISNGRANASASRLGGQGRIYALSAAAVSWSPSDLFASSEVGVWYDPSDITTLFQDTAGTTPVTATTQPVRLMQDKSGNAYHITFSGTNPPTLQVDADGAYYLQPVDATSRGVNASISLAQPFTAMTVANFDLNANELIFDCYNNNGGAFLGQNNLTTSNSLINAGASIQKALPLGKVAMSAVFNGANSIYRVDGSDVATGNLGTNALSGLSLFDLRGNPNPIAGGYSSTLPFYGLLIRSGALTEADKLSVESYFSSKTQLVAAPAATVFAIGDSTVAAYAGGSDLLTFITTSKTKTLVAVPAHTCAQQLTAWNRTKFKHTSSVVVVQCGLNDLNPGVSTATSLTSLQTLVDQAGEYTSGPVFVAKMIPCKQRLIDLYGAVDGLVSYQKWVDINAAIAGDGATPITGVDGRITAHEPLMNDGSGNLLAEYDTGDHIHPNNLGRAVNATAWTNAIGAYL